MEEETQKENIKDNSEDNNNLVNGVLENKNSNEIQEDKGEIKKTNIYNSVEDSHNYSDNKNDCKSTSIEKQDISEDILEQTQSMKNDIHSNNHLGVSGKKNLKSQFGCNKGLSHEITSYLERVEDYKKKKEERLDELKKSVEEKENKNMREKPEISKRSRNMAKSLEKTKTTFLERVKEEQKLAKERKEKLVEKINNEKLKKKEEIEKPMEFNIKSSKVDYKFQKKYEEMMRKDQEVKKKYDVFGELIYKYKMKECIFHPNIGRHEKGEGNKTKIRVNSCELIKRLYDDGIKNHNENRENLKEKYKISFKPKINGKSISLAKKWRQKSENYQKKGISKKKQS